MSNSTTNPLLSLLDAPVGGFDLTKAAPIPQQLAPKDNPHMLGVLSPPSSPSVEPTVEGHTSDGVPLESRFVVEARRFWLRFKANGGPGVDANALALVLQNNAANAAVEFNQRLLEADRNTTALNAQVIDLRAQVEALKAPAYVQTAAEPAKRRGRKPKAEPIFPPTRFNSAPPSPPPPSAPTQPSAQSIIDSVL